MQKENRKSITNMFWGLFHNYGDKNKAKQELQSIHNDSVKVSEELKTLIKNNESLQSLILSIEDYKYDVVEGYRQGKCNADYLAGVDALLSHIKNIISYNEVKDINDVIDFDGIDVGNSGVDIEEEQININNTTEEVT